LTVDAAGNSRKSQQPLRVNRHATLRASSVGTVVDAGQRPRDFLTCLSRMTLEYRDDVTLRFDVDVIGLAQPGRSLVLVLDKWLRSSRELCRVLGRQPLDRDATHLSIGVVRRDGIECG
jgi:hypothetical protein